MNNVPPGPTEAGVTAPTVGWPRLAMAMMGRPCGIDPLAMLDRLQSAALSIFQMTVLTTLLSFSRTAFAALVVLVLATAGAQAKEPIGPEAHKALAALQQLAKQGALPSVEVLPAHGIVRVQGASFARNSHCLPAPVQQELATLVAPVLESALKADERLSLKVIGYSDVYAPGGPPPTMDADCLSVNADEALSAHRASRMARAAAARAEKDGRVDSVGYGSDNNSLLVEAEPQSPRNRRVDIVLVREPVY